MKPSYITGPVCTALPGFTPARPPTDAVTIAGEKILSTVEHEGQRVLAVVEDAGEQVLSVVKDEGQHLLELTRQLHQRVYTTEQRLSMLSDKVEAQSHNR